MNYKSPKWLRKRAAILRRDEYQCQLSRRYGKNVEATTVHHIFPADDWPQYQWEDWNLIALSPAAHDKMHDRNTGALTAVGKELLWRTARRQGIKVEEAAR